MPYYRVPMLIDVFRLTGDDHQENIQSQILYFARSPGGFNYNRAATFQMKAYQGYSDADSLHKQCIGHGNRRDLVENAKVLRLILPWARNREVRVVRLPRHFLTLTKDVSCPLGPSFGFLEDGVMKVFYLHCRNTSRASVVDLSYWAAAIKFELLENEFYELPADIEILNVYPRDRDGNAVQEQ